MIDHSPPADPVLRDFHAALVKAAGTGNIATASVVTTALISARKSSPKFEEEAVREGLVRGWGTIAKIVLVLLGGLVTSEVIAVLHILAEAEATPGAPPPLQLLSAMAAAAMLVMIACIGLAQRSTGARIAYSQWLHGATASLVHDVASGTRRQPNDVILAVAAAGLGSVAALPLLGPFHAEMTATMAAMAENEPR